MQFIYWFLVDTVTSLPTLYTYLPVCQSISTTSQLTYIPLAARVVSEGEADRGYRRVWTGQALLD